jgi:hypothetical protein
LEPKIGIPNQASAGDNDGQKGINHHWRVPKT